MINLAGSPMATTIAAGELALAGIKYFFADSNSGEVPTKIRGRLSHYTLSRAWYYWRVEGLVPMAMAEAIYADPVGRAAVRAGGHCGCVNPREYREMIRTTQGVDVAVMDGGYHIDSQEGLDLFARTAKSPVGAIEL